MLQINDIAQKFVFNSNWPKSDNSIHRKLCLINLKKQYLKYNLLKDAFLNFEFMKIFETTAFYRSIFKNINQYLKNLRNLNV